MPRLENQFLKQFHDAGVYASPRTMQFITRMRKLLYEWGGGFVSERDCAITAATAGAQWEIKIKKAKAASRPPSPLDNLVLPDNGGV